MAERLKLLVMFPRPDDEALGLGSTIAKFSVKGVEMYLVCATRSERGWYDSEGPKPGFGGVTRIREAELRCAEGSRDLREVNFEV